MAESAGYKLGRFFGELPWWVNIAFLLVIITLFVRGCPAVFDQPSIQAVKSSISPELVVTPLKEIGEAPVTALGAKVVEKNLDTPIKNDLNLFIRIEAKVLEIENSLAKYYGSKNQLDELSQIAQTTSMIALNHKKNGAKQEAKNLSNRAEALGRRVDIVARKVFASTVEERFLKQGMDVKVSASGAKHKLLQFNYALMSQPLVYQFQNEMNLPNLARQRGFEQIIYTNGFKSSIGKTWTVNLTK